VIGVTPAMVADDSFAVVLHVPAHVGAMAHEISLCQPLMVAPDSDLDRAPHEPDQLLARLPQTAMPKLKLSGDTAFPISAHAGRPPEREGSRNQ
jgi:hypothetical protein